MGPCPCAVLECGFQNWTALNMCVSKHHILFGPLASNDFWYGASNLICYSNKYRRYDTASVPFDPLSFAGPFESSAFELMWLAFDRCLQQQLCVYIGVKLNPTKLLNKLIYLYFLQLFFSYILNLCYQWHQKLIINKMNISHPTGFFNKRMIDGMFQSKVCFRI